MIRNLGLNQPIMVQYWHFLDNLLHGNLGYSYYTQESVDTMLKQDLPPTISLVVGGLVLWLVVGLAVGHHQRHQAPQLVRQVLHCRGADRPVDAGVRDR